MVHIFYALNASKHEEEQNKVDLWLKTEDFPQHLKIIITQIAKLLWPQSGPDQTRSSGPRAAWNDGNWAVHSCLPDLSHRQAIPRPHVSQDQTNLTGPNLFRWAGSDNTYPNTDISMICQYQIGLWLSFWKCRHLNTWY